jgi:elongation factor P
MIDTVTNIKKDMLIRHEDGLFIVALCNHNVTARGAGSVIVKLKNIETGVNLEIKYRSGDKFEEIELDEIPMEFLYQEGDQYCFMNSSTFEQIMVHKDRIGETIKYLTPNIQVRLMFYKERPLEVKLPNEVTLTVTETGPPLKGATASAQTKPATLETGHVVQVPSFVVTGDKIVVQTQEGVYVSRAKKKQ